MGKTYRKIDEDTVEVTETVIYKMKRENLERAKAEKDADSAELQKAIDEINK